MESSGKQLKKNLFFITILQMSGYIFPLMTFPYVSRVLGLNSVGICNFVDSIVGYFITLSMMGMNAVGIRTIAKNKADPILLRQSFSSLFFLNLITTLVAIAILVSSIFIFPKLTIYKSLFYLGAMKVFFNLFLFEWLFQGLEDFKYITVRSVISKVVYVAAIFIFINNSEDYVLYYFMSVALVIINAIVDFLYARKVVGISWKNVNIKTYVAPFFKMGVYFLISSLYISFNVAYLGFVSGEKEVGNFTTAVKLFTIVMAIFTAFTAVMSPRISSLVSEKKFDDINDLIEKSFDLLTMMSFPLIIYFIVMAPEIVALVAGPGFEGAILPMRIISPLLLIIGLEQILIVQLLIPFNKDKAILTNAVIGALVGIALNILLVKNFQSVGSGIVWLVAEICVLISASYFIKKFIAVKVPVKKIAMNFIYSIPYILIILFIKTTPLPSVLMLLIGPVFFILYFVVLHVYILKNHFLINQLISNKYLKVLVR